MAESTNFTLVTPQIKILIETEIGNAGTQPKRDRLTHVYKRGCLEIGSFKPFWDTFFYSHLGRVYALKIQCAKAILLLT